MTMARVFLGAANQWVFVVLCFTMWIAPPTLGQKLTSALECPGAGQDEISLFITNLERGGVGGEPISSDAALQRLSGYGFFDKTTLNEISSESYQGRKSNNGPSGSNMCSIPINQAGRLLPGGAGGRKLLECMPYFGCHYYGNAIFEMPSGAPPPPPVVVTICVSTCCTSFQMSSPNSKGFYWAGRSVCPDFFPELKPATPIARPPDKVTVAPSPDSNTDSEGGNDSQTSAPDEGPTDVKIGKLSQNPNNDITSKLRTGDR